MTSTTCGIVILNWNGYQDTIECLDSLHGVRDADIRVVVVDNGSTDGSIDRISAHLLRLGQAVDTIGSYQGELRPQSSNRSFTIIDNGRNSCFAGGCNVGINYCFQKLGCRYVWLLNGDARAQPDSLSPLVRKMESNPDLGFCGSLIVDHDDHDVIQCYGGGIILPFLGKRKLTLKGRRVSSIGSGVEPPVDYLMGASMLIRREVADSIGLMDESYFMYAEELDWQLRAINQGWKIGVARDSIVPHKGGASTSGRSHLYHYYINRSSVMFTKRFFGPAYLLCATPALLLIVAAQNWRRPKNVLYGWRGIAEGLRFRWPVREHFPLERRFI